MGRIDYQPYQELPVGKLSSLATAISRVCGKENLSHSSDGPWLGVVKGHNGERHHGRGCRLMARPYCLNTPASRANDMPRSKMCA